MNNLLEIRDLHKSYSGGEEPTAVLRGISLTLQGGDSLAVMGVSGSGKSTLLNILGTLDEPTSGIVRLGGVDPFALGREELAALRRQAIGFVFQDHHLLPQLTAMENVLIATLAGGVARKPDIERAGELLAEVGLSSRRDHLPGELSGGERQRVAIARALMNRPTLLLADEPTGNLDAASGEQVAGLLLSLGRQSGAILVVATHSETLAARLGQKRRLHAGKFDEGAS